LVSHGFLLVLKGSRVGSSGVRRQRVPAAEVDLPVGQREQEQDRAEKDQDDAGGGRDRADE
jgi:hypothetical protein